MRLPSSHPVAQPAGADRRLAVDAAFIQLACCCSGAAGLVFEMVWFHRASVVFGSSVWSTSLVLSSFMGGLALGSAAVAAFGHRLRHVLRAYAGLECAVAASGVVLTQVLPALTAGVVLLTQPARDDAWITNLTRFALAFGLLLVPATAMGATLPLLASGLSRARPGFGRALGVAYGWNTLGAVAGVVSAETLLIGVLGVTGTAWVAAALCLAAAGLVWSRFGRATGEDRTTAVAAGAEHSLEAPPGRSGVAAPRAVHPASIGLLLSAFLAGAVMLALEVLWFRFLTLYVLSTTLAASLMLSSVLTGIAGGGLLASAWLHARPLTRGTLVGVACALGASVVGTYAAFGSLTTGVQVGSWVRTLVMAAALTLPSALLSGLLFTFLGDALHLALGAATRAAGWLTVANTLGGMCGPLVAAFILLPSFGLEQSFFLCAAACVPMALAGALAPAGGLNATQAMAVPARTRPPGNARAWGAAPAAALGLALSLVWFPFGRMASTYVPRVAAPYTADGAEVVATREGPSETIFITQQKWMERPVYSRLVTNGFSMSGTSVPALRYMKYFVYWPAMLHQGPLERVLVICFGVGVTAQAALDLPSLRSLDVAEISSDVLAVSDIIHPTNHPLRDPRVRVHAEDGRQFLASTSDRFDLITGEPPPPRTPGAAFIYSREYFEMVGDRLAPGGITTYWLPVGRPDPGTNVTSIIRAFCDVFSDCSLWNATPFDLMLVGSRGASAAPAGAGTGPVGEDAFVAPWSTPALRARLAELGFELPQQVGATFIGDADYLNELTRGEPGLDDDHPHRLHPVPGRPSLSDPGYGVDRAVTRHYDEVMNPERAAKAFAASAFIKGRWPPRVLEATLPYFDEQRVLNRTLWEGGRPLARIEDVHRLLTRTPLRTLPLWVLGLDVVKEGIAREHDDGSGAAQYARGLTALADRDFIRAAEHLAESERRGLRAETVRPLLVYALCQAGQRDMARTLAPAALPATPDERHFWQWMTVTFGVGPQS